MHHEALSVSWQQLCVSWQQLPFLTAYMAFTSTFNLKYGFNTLEKRSEVIVVRCSVEKVFLEISQTS